MLAALACPLRPNARRPTHSRSRTGRRASRSSRDVRVHPAPAHHTLRNSTAHTPHARRAAAHASHAHAHVHARTHAPWEAARSAHATHHRVHPATHAAHHRRVHPACAGHLEHAGVKSSEGLRVEGRVACAGPDVSADGVATEVTWLTREASARGACCRLHIFATRCCCSCFFVREVVPLVTWLSQLDVDLTAKLTNLCRGEREIINAPIFRRFLNSRNRGRVGRSYPRKRQTRNLCFGLFRDPT